MTSRKGSAFVMENVQSRSVLDLLKVGDAQLFASSGTFNVSVTTTEHRKNKYLKSRVWMFHFLSSNAAITFLLTNVTRNP